ncbi:uncharacterized protein VTP21DRAFT_8458 [Calcarisporiella thermophila]|uniref:uncharacterized protein n=1 Tax=Calcarisporiella thermophila TaxID=911321 RepID=UPI00374328EF
MAELESAADRENTDTKVTAADQTAISASEATRQKSPSKSDTDQLPPLPPLSIPLTCVSSPSANSTEFSPSNRRQSQRSGLNSPSSPATQDGLSDSSMAGRGARRQASQRNNYIIRPKRPYRPRWHNQGYMVFLALRSSGKKWMARGELCRTAVELDEKISKQRGLPRVFRSKTPINSASAVLTTNSDKLFVAFKPEGERSTYFRLSYEPANFDQAVSTYNEWMKKLIEHDWPLCFGVPKEKNGLSADEVEQTSTQTADGHERKNESSTGEGNGEGELKRKHVEEGEQEIVKRQRAQETDPELADMTRTENGVHGPPNPELNGGPGQEQLLSEQPATSEGDEDAPIFSKDLATASEAKTLPSDDPSWVNIEDLDLSNVPKSLDDIVEVRPSTIPGAGRGLFAKRFLPFNTPLGFYFGVPMTEDEFDSMKDGVGIASSYSIMYRKTVLDATDENGQPFTDPNGKLYCHFHFMNENTSGGGNITFLEGNTVNQVICWTTRDIQPDEELFVYYGKEVDREHWNRSGSEATNTGEHPGGQNETLPEDSPST